MSKQTDLINIPDAITVDGTKVGIGTTSPTLPLDIVSNAAADALKIRARPTSDDYGTLTFYNNAGTTKWADIQSNVAKDLRFYTNGGTERMRILSGGGITFNGDTAAANALNDYEEGTWTPRIVGSSSESGQSYQRQEGYYTKIGNKVFCRFILNFSARGSFSGDYIMDGFPFNCEGPADINLGSLYHSYVGQNVIYIGLYNRPNDNKAYIWIKTQAGQSREYPNSSFLTNDTELSGSFTIQTTA
jgi:hypothetical protein